MAVTLPEGRAAAAAHWPFWPPPGQTLYPCPGAFQLDLTGILSEAVKKSNEGLDRLVEGLLL